MRSDSLFVEDEGWEPVQDDDDDENENARLGWDQNADLVSASSSLCSPLIKKNPSAIRMNHEEGREAPGLGAPRAQTAEAESTYLLEPTQKLSDVHDLALFPE